MKPTARALALAGAGALVVTLTALSTGHSASAAPPAAANACTPLSVTKVSYVAPDGSARSRPDSTTATVYHLALQPGDDIQETVPPASFNPLTAPASALKTFGFPARPAGTATAANKSWTAHYQHYKPQPYAPMCASGGARNYIFNGESWAGIEADNNGDYVRAWTDIRIPNMNPASCPTPNAISLWTGLGGDDRIGSGNLIQSGFATPVTGTANDVVDAWWEMLNSSTPNNPQVTVKTSFAKAGDLTYSDTWYDPDTGVAHFAWENLTTNYVQNPVSVSYYHGFNAAGYYDGRLADWILERPLRSTGLTYLRQFTVHGWGGAQATRRGQAPQNVSALPHDEVDMYNHSLTRIAANVYNHGLTGVNNWGDQWRSCSGPS